MRRGLYTITGLGSVAVTGSVKLVLTAAQAQGDNTTTSGEWVTAPKSGCKGTWSGKATDGSGSAGAGSFELRRQ